MEIVSVGDDGLGHTSFVIGLDDGTAAVTDPARFPDRQRTIARTRGWTIAWTADTHSHADYISGSPELAADGAEFLASAGAGLALPHRSVDPDDEIRLGSTASLRAIATPGHTPDHLAYLLLDDGDPVGLFSGGSLMVGALGRTDLLGDDRRDDLARQLFHALRSRVLTLPDDLPVYPTHGAGSFCSAPAGSARTTTIGAERATNPLLAIDDEDRFVSALLDGLGSFPDYFRQLPEINRLGPPMYPTPPALARLDVASVRRHLDAGAVLVDVRSVAAFAERHAAGSLSIALRPSFATWLGWLIDLDRPVVFLADDDCDRDDLVRQSLTVGHDAMVGELDGGLDAWMAAGLPTATVPLVTAEEIGGQVLDIRQRPEWDAGHLPDAVHVELAAVADADVPTGPLTVMCGHGERAMTAASILTGRGHDDVSVLAGGPDDWVAASGRDLTVG